MACLTSAIEPLRAANEITGQRAFRWSVVGEDRSRIASSAEVLFEPSLALSDARDLDYLFFLSGPAGDFQNRRKGRGECRWLARLGVVRVWDLTPLAESVQARDPIRRYRIAPNTWSTRFIDATTVETTDFNGMITRWDLATGGQVE